MPERTDQHYLRTHQYKNASNLSARAQLHQRFGVNKYGWPRWVFDHLDLDTHGRILDLGCGSGLLWLRNADRIPPTSDITLLDLSFGMARDARGALKRMTHPFKLSVADAQFIPFTDNTFDAVAAIHMLFHVPQFDKALAEIRRVLIPHGVLCATTVGRNSMKELHGLVRRFDSSYTPSHISTPFSFVLDDGKEQLSPWFHDVLFHRYEDALVVTEAEPIVVYIASLAATSGFARHWFERLTTFVQQELDQHGPIHITKETGMFVAK